MAEKKDFRDYRQMSGEELVADRLRKWEKMYEEYAEEGMNPIPLWEKGDYKLPHPEGFVPKMLLYPTHKGLSVNPCIPKDFGDFSIVRKYREGTYYINVKNPANVEKGIHSIVVDGVPADGCIIPYESGIAEYHVIITMG